MGKTITLIYKWILSNIVLVVFLGMGLYLYFEIVEYRPRVVFMDVGQGDAILLIDESGQKILIDGGAGNYIVYSIANYLHPRDRFIDTVILTHPHEDHLSGLIDIFERYDVGEVLYYPVCYSSGLYRYFLDLNENISPMKKEYFFEGNSFSLEYLYPKDDVDDECIKFSNVNNASIVLKLHSDSGSILFMGDAEHEVEEVLMEKYTKTDLDSDVLKAGHHCSRTASSTGFLRYITPFYAICSVGKDNKFGHPHKEVVEIFESFDIEYDLTHEKGDIVVEL